MFTQEQLAVIEGAPGNTAVYAAPGSGKTTVLTHHMMRQIQTRRFAPTQLMAVTFTKQGALEMRQRLRSHNMSVTQCESVSIGTFHAQWFRVLLGCCSDVPVLLSQTEQRRWLLRALSEECRTGAAYVRQLQQVLSRIKSGWPPPDLHGRLRRVVQRYEQYKAHARRWDFDDILITFCTMCETNPQILDGLRHIKYLLIDEYQDTNPIQWQIVQHVHRYTEVPVFVVGDDDQAIYGFRGSNPKWLRAFPSAFQNAQIHRLTQNFRSDSDIVTAASRLIQRNGNREPKALRSARTEAGKCCVHYYKNEAEEAAGVLELVLKRTAGQPNVQIAVLARTRKQLYPFAAAARTRVSGIEFRTFHDAKGKEWDVVHILDAVEENPFLGQDAHVPKWMNVDSIVSLDLADNEEERRLFYVAITRARHECWIHVPSTLRGKRMRAVRFISEAGLR